MDIIYVLAVAIFIEKSCSQTLQTSPTCFKEGNELKIECITADFSQGINFLLDAVNQGGCNPGCASNIVQSAGTTTTYTLTFSSSTHSGNWTCSYGSSVSTVAVIAENPCVETTMGSMEGVETTMATIEGSSGGDGTGLTTGTTVGIVFAVLVVVVAAIVLCCILNTRCKFGDACRDSKLSFTFPPESKEKVIPKSNLGKDKGTPNKDGKENITPKLKSGVEDDIPIQEIILNNDLKNGISSLTTSQPRSGANQPLKPVNES